MKANHFFKGLSWLLLLNILIKPAWIFVIDRQVQNTVGHEVYGTYFALMNLCYVLLFIADAGLSNMLTQKLAANERLNVRQLLRLKLVLVLFYAATCFVVAYLTGITQWFVLFYSIFIQSFTSLFLFLRSLLIARQHFNAGAFFSVLDKGLLLLLCIGPVYGFIRPLTIILFLQLQAVSISIAAGSLLLLLASKKELTAGQKTSIKTLARWTAPFILVILLMSAHSRLDAFLLERLHHDGARQAGIYAMAFRLLDAGNVAGYLTASFLLPFLSRNQHNRPLLQKTILLSRHGLLFIASGAVAFVIVFAPWLLEILYQTTEATSIAVMRLCLLSLPAYYLIHVYGSALTATANFSLFIRINLLAMTTNVLLNVLLIPDYGALGCCLAALVTQYGCSILLWISASRKLAISLSAGTATLYLFAIALLSFCFYFGQKLIGNVWIILAAISAVILIVLTLQRNAIRKVFLSFYN